MNTKIVSVTIGVLLLVGVGIIVGKMSAPSPVVQQPQETPPYGAVATLDNVNSPLLCLNGLCTYNFNKPFIGSSTEICIITNPFLATSTILNWSLETTANGANLAQTVDVSTTTNSVGYGSSTVAIARLTVPTGKSNFVGGNFSTSTLSTNLLNTASSGASLYFLAPNESLTFRIATATPGTGYLTGTCKAQIVR